MFWLWSLYSIFLWVTPNRKYRKVERSLYFHYSIVSLSCGLALKRANFQQVFYFCFKEFLIQLKRTRMLQIFAQNFTQGEQVYFLNFLSLHLGWFELLSLIKKCTIILWYSCLTLLEAKICLFLFTLSSEQLRVPS